VNPHVLDLPGASKRHFVLELDFVSPLLLLLLVLVLPSQKLLTP